MREYSRTVNLYINKFWKDDVRKMDLRKDRLNSVKSWFTQNIKQDASIEAINIIGLMKHHVGKKPRHKVGSMCLTSNTIKCQDSGTEEFDLWLHLRGIGNKIIFDVPIKKHRHFNKLELIGKRLNSYVITKDYVTFSFEIETGPKKDVKEIVGMDTGIDTLATLSNGKQFGGNIKESIKRINRCKHGSNGQKRATSALRNKMSYIAKQIIGSGMDMIVIESLKNITQKTKMKGKIVKNTRKLIGRWNVRYFQDRIRQLSELNRISFRTVYPAYTSQTCSSCGSTDRKNRNKEVFKCKSCGYEANADINAAVNIRSRFLLGKYGSQYKHIN